MNHKISSAIGEILEEQGTSLAVAEVISKLKTMFSETELNDFSKVLGFDDLEQAVKAIMNDITG